MIRCETLEWDNENILDSLTLYAYQVKETHTTLSQVLRYQTTLLKNKIPPSNTPNRKTATNIIIAAMGKCPVTCMIPAANSMPNPRHLTKTIFRSGRKRGRTQQNGPRKNVCFHCRR